MVGHESSDRLGRQPPVAERGTAAARPWVDEGWIFSDQIGQELNPRTDWDNLKKLLRAAGSTGWASDSPCQLAVAAGFEPAEAFTSRAFEARSLGRSDTPPPVRLPAAGRMGESVHPEDFTPTSHR